MSLDKLISNNKAMISVLGLGYVGLPLAVEAARAGYTVNGIDIDPEKVAMLKTGDCYVDDVSSSLLYEVIASEHLRIGSSFEPLNKSDIILICVPTPLDNHKQPDLTSVESASREIATRVKKQTLVILESTTFPGTTENVVLPILESSGLKNKEDFFLAFSPERVDPGNQNYKTHNTPKIVGGSGQKASNLTKNFYESFLSGGTFLVKSPAEAEMAKILENTFRIVNIALVNEMMVIAEKMGINLWEVIDAASTKPFGFMPFYPGPGVGGHCIPIDPFYLTYASREFGYHTRLIELAGEINDYMPSYVVTRLMELLNDHCKCTKGSNILMIGLAYKADISDLRESPALKILEILERHGASVNVVDPYLGSFQWKGSQKQTISLSEQVVRDADAVLIVTAHKGGVDYKTIHENASLVLDTRNAIKQAGLPKSSNIFLL